MDARGFVRSCGLVQIEIAESLFPVGCRQPLLHLAQRESAQWTESASSKGNDRHQPRHQLNRDAFAVAAVVYLEFMLARWQAAKDQAFCVSRCNLDLRPCREAHSQWLIAKI